MFFFAGHGEIHDGHDYLLPIDVDPGDIAGTALRVSDIADALRNCGADNTVLLVDACRDRGKRKGQGFGIEDQRGMVTIYACSPRQSSYEIEDLQHGSFTYALLEGLRLQGANNCATVERLDQYLCSQVPRLNARYGKPPQMPYTSVEPSSKSYLILIPQQATRLQDVMALKNYAYRAEHDDDLDLAQQLWVRVLAASPADQDAIVSIGRIAIKQRTQQTTSPLPPPATAGSRRIDAPTSEAKVPPPVSQAHRIERLEVSPVQNNPTAQQSLTFEFEVVTITSIKTRLLGLGVPQVITQTHKAQAEYRREKLGKGASLDLVIVPGGTFQMGSPSGQGGDDERPQHSVNVKPFLMGKYLVTQAQWRAVAALPKVDGELRADPSGFKGDRLPVEQVSWDDTVEFCQRLSKHTNREYRLPSEAEWEYACRAKTTTPFHFGKTLTADLANYDANHTYGDGPKGTYRKQTTNVGTHIPPFEVSHSGINDRALFWKDFHGLAVQMN